MEPTFDSAKTKPLFDGINTIPFKNQTRTDYKYSLIFATIGAIICMCIYFIFNNILIEYHAPYAFGQDTIIPAPIFSIPIDISIYDTITGHKPYYILYGINVFIFGLFGWLFLFVHSLNGISKFKRFIINFAGTLILSFIYSYYIVYSIENCIPMGFYQSSFWTIVFQQALPAVFMIYITIPNIISLISDIAIKKQKSNNCIIYDLLFLIISTSLFTFVYWNQF